MVQMELNSLFAGKYEGTRVLLTGHTGFKGSWLSLWLTEMGALVKGISLPGDEVESHWKNLALDNVIDARLDILDYEKLKKEIHDFEPEIIFHLAAQSLVRKSYSDPLTTWSTNVLGTANVLEACRTCSSVKAIVVVTTDKCYENKEWLWGYRENDELGGHDPYSASKAATELLVSSYRRSFFIPAGVTLIATARAGNVIGGGDWSEDRLIPDIIKGHIQGLPAVIRSPDSTRPWQHVLESLSGYLLLGQKLLENKTSFADSWNFGPGNEGNCRVIDVLNQMQSVWPELSWVATENKGPHEASLLQLDCTKALHRLSWKPVWNLQQTICQTAEWYRTWKDDYRLVSRRQLEEYVIAAKETQLPWCLS